MKLGTIEVLDYGFIFEEPDGKTHGCINTESLVAVLKKCMSDQLLFRSNKGEKYVFEMNKIAPR